MWNMWPSELINIKLSERTMIPLSDGCKTDDQGTQRWYLNGRLHRDDGPAIEWADGNKQWWVFGCTHRVDGPATEYVNGNKEYWYDDKYLGKNDIGFWALWELLDDRQRSNIDLLMHLPK